MSNETNNNEIAIEELIPLGRANAVSRKYLASVTGLDDRKVRRLISNSTAPIVNLGYGYFQPNMEDSVDVSEARAYVAQERARIRSLEEKLDAKFAGIV